MSVRLPWLALFVVFGGCLRNEPIEITDVATHATSIELEIRNDDTTSRVFAAIHLGSFESTTFARLGTGDRLILTDPSGGKRQLGGLVVPGKVAYGVELPATSGEFVVDFLRDRGASAVGNRVFVPPPFALSGASGEISRRAAIALRWDASPGAHTMRYEIEGDCLAAVTPRAIVGDPGTLTIGAGELAAIAGREQESCAVTIRLLRTAETEDCCSAEFGHPSRARGIQERTAVVTSVP
jgi:hypothetical protein